MRRKQIIIIPAYKPTNLLVSLFDELKTVFSTIIVVDDGGEDEYEKIFSDIAEKGGIVLRHYVNLGKGRALKTALNYCLSKEIDPTSGVVTVDADGQHALNDIIKICDKMDMYPDSLVLGCRCFKNKNIPLRSRFGNKLSKVVYEWLCGLDISDTQTGLRGLPCSFIKETCRIPGERYEYETNMLLSAKSNGLKFQEVPIATIYVGNNETSHFNPLRDSIMIYSILLKYSISSFLSVIIDYFMFWFLTNADMNIFAATYIARICSTIVNFRVNRNVVFKHKGKISVQLSKYLALVLVSGTISGFCVSKLSAALGVSTIGIKIIVELILYFMNYYIQRKYIFAEREGMS